MKNITLFIGSLSSGGAEHQLVQLANLLSELGYKITIVTYADIPDHYQFNNGIRRIQLAKGKHSVIKFYAIFTYFLKVKTDCVISYTQRSSSFALPSLFLRRKIKVIVGERNLSTGNVSFLERLLFAFLYKRANYIVPNSFSQTNYILDKYPSYRQKVKTIINYTDIQLYKGEIFPDSNIVKIGVFARYTQQKNCKRFIEAINLLKTKTNISFEVHWYGNKKVHNNFSTYYLELEELVSSYGLNNVFYLHNQVREVQNVICNLELLCLPSLYEGFSNSLSEYVCCSRPVLASNVSDNSVMVHDGENGFLFDPYDVENICNSFLKYFNLSKKQRIEMGKNSRIIAEKLFDKQRFIESYIQLIGK